MEARRDTFELLRRWPKVSSVSLSSSQDTRQARIIPPMKNIGNRILRRRIAMTRAPSTPATIRQKPATARESMTTEKTATAQRNPQLRIYTRRFPNQAMRYRPIDITRAEMKYFQRFAKG